MIHWLPLLNKIFHKYVRKRISNRSNLLLSCDLVASMSQNKFEYNNEPQWIILTQDFDSKIILLLKCRILLSNRASMLYFFFFYAVFQRKLLFHSCVMFTKMQGWSIIRFPVLWLADWSKHRLWLVNWVNSPTEMIYAWTRWWCRTRGVLWEMHEHNSYYNYTKRWLELWLYTNNIQSA